MSLQVWLPLDGRLDNLGLNDIQPVNNGATIGANTQGKIGKCYIFNNNYLTLPSYNMYNDEFSITTWAYLDVNNVTHTICCNRKSVGLGFSIFLINQKLRIDAGIDNSSLQWITNFTYPVTTWFHLAIVRTKTSVKYYINGIFQQQQNKTLTSSNFMNLTSIGASQYNGTAYSYNNYLKGRLNDFRIYDHALSDKEIKENSKGLVRHYPLNEYFGNPNLLSSNFYSIAPWTRGYGGEQVYKGEKAILINPASLHRQGDIFPNVTYESGKRYTISFDICDHLRTDSYNTGMYLIFGYTDESASSSYSMVSGIANNNANWIHRKYTSKEGSDVSTITMSYGHGGQVSIANLKLQEGTEETPWTPFIDEVDNIAYDCSGYGYNMAMSPTRLSYGTGSPHYLSCMKFNGSNNYLKGQTCITLPTDEITISMWAYNQNWNRRLTLISCTEGGGWNFQITAAGKMGFPVYANGSYTPYPSITLLEPGWHHFVGTFDGKDKKFYIDNQLIGIGHASDTKVKITYNSNTRLYVGCEANGANPTSPYWDGLISDVRIYCTALSENDIKQLYEVATSIDNQGNLYTYEICENSEEQYI